MSIKIHVGIIVTIEKLILKYTQKRKKKKLEHPRQLWKRANVDIVQFKIFYKATLSRKNSIGGKVKQIGQWNRRETLEIDPLEYCFLIFDKGTKTIQWKKASLFNKWSLE